MSPKMLYSGWFYSLTKVFAARLCILLIECEIINVRRPFIAGH